MQREHWRFIKEYGHRYQISDRGRVKSFQRGKERILSQHLNHRGKPCVTLYCYGKRSTHTVASLLKKAFVEHEKSFFTGHLVGGIARKIG